MCVSCIVILLAQILPLPLYILAMLELATLTHCVPHTLMAYFTRPNDGTNHLWNQTPEIYRQNKSPSF